MTTKPRRPRLSRAVFNALWDCVDTATEDSASWLENMLMDEEQTATIKEHIRQQDRARDYLAGLEKWYNANPNNAVGRISA